MSGDGKSSEYFIGMDIGSTTIKAVVVENRSDEILWRDYKRHETKLGANAFDFLNRIERDTGANRSNTRIFLTGSG